MKKEIDLQEANSNSCRQSEPTTKRAKSRGPGQAITGFDCRSNDWYHDLYRQL